MKKETILTVEKPAPAVKKSSYRLRVYDVIHKIIGRTLTVTEHDEVKKVLVEYVHMESGYVANVEEAMQRQGEKLNVLNKTMLGKLQSFIDKQGVDPEKVEVLKKLVNDLKS